MRFLSLAGLVLLALTARADWPFPTAAGTTWRYRLTTEPTNNSSSLVREIFPAQIGKLGNVMRLETEIDGHPRATTFLKNVGSAVFAVGRKRADGGIVSFDPPGTILPANSSEEWDFTGEIAGIDCDLNLRELGNEEVVVPAGKFQAVHLRGEQSSGYSTIVERWFVRDVGWVKEVVTQRSPGGELLLRNTAELLELPAAPRATPAEVAKPLEVSISTSSDGDALTTIPADALQIIARWHGRSLTRGAKLRAVWVAEDTNASAPAGYVVDEASTIVTSPDAFGRFTLSRPPDGWAMGRYRVDFYLGPTLAETIRLVISPSSAPPKESILLNPIQH